MVTDKSVMHAHFERIARPMLNATELHVKDVRRLKAYCRRAIHETLKSLLQNEKKHSSVLWICGTHLPIAEQYS